MKEKSELKKIVILTDDPKKSNRLVLCLRILFPECEILFKTTHEKSPDKKPTPLYPVPSYQIGPDIR